MTTGYYPTPAQVAEAKENRRKEGATTDPMMTRGPDVAQMVDYWNMVDDIMGGIKTMRAGGEAYLPRFVSEEQPNYAYRLKMTKLTNVYSDVVQALAAKPFERPVTFEDNTVVPPAIEEFIENVDGAGNNLTVFAGMTFFNGINSAIDWIFIDYPAPDPNKPVVTIADAKAANIRPYWSHVLGRNVLEVRSEMNGSAETLTYMRIYEPGQPDHIRVFERIGNQVKWYLFEKGSTYIDVAIEAGLSLANMSQNPQTLFKLADEGILSIGVIPLVPFITGRRDGRMWSMSPPMQDAAELQIDLYQLESGIKYAEVLTAYPMLAANGIMPPKGQDGQPLPVAIGPGKVLFSPPDEQGRIGSWTFIEPSATSLTFLKAHATDTKADIRELGRQPLTAQSGNLTVITTAVAAGKAKTTVGQWAFLLKDTLENALDITCMFMNLTDFDPDVSVYTEFDEFVSNDNFDTILTMQKQKIISNKATVIEAQRRGILSSSYDADEDAQQMLNETVGGKSGPDNTGNDEPPPDDDLAGSTGQETAPTVDDQGVTQP